MALTQQAVVNTLVADRSKLLAYTWSIVRNHHATEDIYQEVVLAAMPHTEEMKDQGHVLAWARRAARLRAIDWLRREKRQAQLLDGSVLDLLEEDWRRLDAERPELSLEALRDCVMKLTSYARQLIRLRYVEGLSGLEVSRRMQRSPHTIYVALGRIYRQLEECVQQEMAEKGTGPSDDTAGN